MRFSRASLQAAFSKILLGRKLRGKDNNPVLSAAYPDDLNAVEIFRDRWISSIPGFEQATGWFPAFADSRIQWLLDHNDIRGFKILELGPLDGGHTYMYEKIGGARVTAIEAAKDHFLSCLIIKNIFNLDAKFLYGDFCKYLAATDENYDLISAIGILYHMTDPVGLIGNAAKHTDKLLLWTHYYCASRHTPAFDAQATVSVYKEKEIRMWKQYYGEKPANFLGGVEAYSYWLERGSLLELLDMAGFNKVNIISENTHKDFCDIFLFATK